MKANEGKIVDFHKLIGKFMHDVESNSNRYK